MQYGTISKLAKISTQTRETLTPQLLKFWPKQTA